MGKKKISDADWEALRLHYTGISDVEAYRRTHPKASDETCSGNAANYFKRLKSKLDIADELKLRNLGADRVLNEMELRLNSMTTKFFKGRRIADLEDNGTRMRATELLAEINGMRKLDIDLNAGQNPLNIVMTMASKADFTDADNVEVGGEDE